MPGDSLLILTLACPGLLDFSGRWQTTDMLVTPETHNSTTEYPSSAVKTPAELKFDKQDDFQRVLKERVEQYFSTSGKHPRDCWQMYVKCFVILSWFFGSYALLVFGPITWMMAIPLAASVGLAMAAIGFSIQHDGGHRAFSDFPIVNRMAALTLDMLGGSSYYWARKHNSIHHTYANITGHDDDIDLGLLGRLSPHQKHLKFHRLQHFYLWFLYGFLTIKWQFYDDFRDMVRGRIGAHRVARPTGTDLALLLGGKLFFVVMAFVVPLMLHPWWMVLPTYLCVSFFQGVTLSTIFQIAHCVEDATFPMPEPATGRMNATFASHQIETTVDFAPNNRLLSWFVGGLNYQIEHHLFPQICHIHYRALAPVVQQTCREFGVRYTVHDTLSSGIASHYRWLRRMGAADA